MGCLKSLRNRGMRWAAVAFLVVPAAAAGQDYPTRTVRMIAPFSPGGGADALARILAKGLTEVLKQQVIVDNRGGASGIIGTELVAKSAPDGYTVGFVMSAHAINASFRDKLPYDPVNDFAPVSLFTEVPFILVVHPSLPARSVPELIKLLRSRPGQVDYASTGIGSSPHFAAEMFNVYAKVKMVHITYKGVGGAVADVMAGAVPITFQGPLGVMPQARAGKLRALAVTSATRSPAFPDLPTVQEGGVPNYHFTNWYGVLAPRATPGATVNRLHQAIAQALQDKEVLKSLAVSGAEPRGLAPDRFREHLKTEIARYVELVRQIGGLRAE